MGGQPGAEREGASGWNLSSGAKWSTSGVRLNGYCQRSSEPRCPSTSRLSPLPSAFCPLPPPSAPVTAIIRAALKVTETSLPGVLLLQPRVHGDARRFFMETYHAERFRELGIDAVFVQDNHSRSARGVVRGLLY